MHRPLLVACALAAAPAFAQTPAVVTGTLDSRAATEPVGREIATIMSSASGATWVGYAVPVNRRDRDDNGCWSSGDASGRTQVAPLKLEGSNRQACS
jgi:hypothetical protein